MDTDISKMFKDKNKEIFKNSLILEIERNLETLKNTTDNCVALEINKLFLFFKKYFQEIEIEYKKEELLGILYKERKDINDIVNKKIEEKKERIKTNFLAKENKEEILTTDFLDSYYNELINETKKINEEIELEVSKEITTIFSSKIIKKYKLESIEQSERIHSRIDILFKNNIIQRVKEQIEFRDESLKNIAMESFNKYIELNKNTIEQNS
jgi:hypothetical protein